MKPRNLLGKRYALLKAIAKDLDGLSADPLDSIHAISRKAYNVARRLTKEGFLVIRSRPPGIRWFAVPEGKTDSPTGMLRL